MIKKLSKKGDGLSLNVIVMAVIALLVLIIIIYMFTRGTSTFNTGVGDCPGGCIVEGDSCPSTPGSNFVKVPSSCKVSGSDTGKTYCCTDVSVK